jgi:hypothetical protein
VTLPLPLILAFSPGGEGTRSVCISRLSKCHCGQSHFPGSTVCDRIPSGRKMTPPLACSPRTGIAAGSNLNSPPGRMPAPTADPLAPANRQTRAISSAGERSPHTGEAAGSIPASPTNYLYPALFVSTIPLHKLEPRHPDPDGFQDYISGTDKPPCIDLASARSSRSRSSLASVDVSRTALPKTFRPSSSYP